MVDLPLDRFLVLPCGIDLDEFRSNRDEEVMQEYGLPETYVICPGALTTSKGPQNVVEASREYADIAPTIFIGDGELRDEIKSGLGDRGRLLGFDSAGTPSVAYDGGGVSSIITAETGNLTDRDPKVLGRAVRVAIESRAAELDGQQRT
jgi:glycosyltransferase involved in cell wall biosynthesis